MKAHRLPAARLKIPHNLEIRPFVTLFPPNRRTPQLKRRTQRIPLHFLAFSSTFALSVAADRSVERLN